jgi:hypothetical protein
MQITINVPDTLPQELLKQRIKDIEQSFITEAKFFANFSKHQTSEQETNYLLSTPANAQRLLHSLEQARNGQLSAKELIEE